jgi:hypothetical protein
VLPQEMLSHSAWLLVALPLQLASLSLLALSL